MMAYGYQSLDAAQRAAHSMADQFDIEIGVWEGGYWGDPTASYTVKVPCERKHAPIVDGAVYVALPGELA